MDHSSSKHESSLPLLHKSLIIFLELILGHKCKWKCDSILKIFPGNYSLQENQKLWFQTLKHFSWVTAIYNTNTGMFISYNRTAWASSCHLRSSGQDVIGTFRIWFFRSHWTSSGHTLRNYTDVGGYYFLGYSALRMVLLHQYHCITKLTRNNELDVANSHLSPM